VAARISAAMPSTICLPFVPAPTASVPPPECPNARIRNRSRAEAAKNKERGREGAGAAAQMKWGLALLPTPTVRRAKDPPNLRTRSQGNPFPNFGSPAQASLPTDHSLVKRSLATSTPVRQPKPRFCFVPPGLTEVKADRCSAALLGKTLNCVPLCFQRPESRLLPRRAVERSSLPAPLPGWPREASEETSHCPPRRSDRWSPAASCFRCRLSDEAGTAVPITNAH
jgi:hypothetical protein